ncbi:MAG: ferrous iron transport protein A [Synergistaceae bacterium]|jgi:ferrous iron transport protein A|nr:ferrous iron transport protein A [Synergistaceae bacterium]
MPLTLAKSGEQYIIQRVGGLVATRQFLEKLGFVPGGKVAVIAETGGNVVVCVKDSRVAISREMAIKITIGE